MKKPGTIAAEGYFADLVWLHVTNLPFSIGSDQCRVHSLGRISRTLVIDPAQTFMEEEEMISVMTLIAAMNAKSVNTLNSEFSHKRDLDLYFGHIYTSFTRRIQPGQLHEDAKSATTRCEFEY